MLWKYYTQYANKFEKLSSGHRTGKGQFIPVPVKGNAKECSNYRTIALISHASKAMLKILQATLQQYMNCELPDIQAGFRKGKRIPENVYFCFTDYAKAFEYVDHNKLWKILKEMRIPDHLTWGQDNS